MKMNHRWALPLALVAGTILGATLNQRSRTVKRKGDRLMHKENVSTWEGEGGGLAATRHRG
jgi:hypothetical protein